MGNVPTDEPAMQDALARYIAGHRRAGGAADIAATIVLLVLHAVLFGTTMLILVVLVMSTDPCAYQACGDPAWVDRAIGLGGVAGAAILVADLAIAVRRLTRRRLAFFVPIIGCAAQLALGAGAVALESLAGPL